MDITWQNFLDTLINRSGVYNEKPIADTETAQADAIHCASAYLDFLKCQKNEIARHLTEMLDFNIKLAEARDNWRSLSIFMASVGKNMRGEGESSLEIAGKIIENIAQSTLSRNG